MGEDPSTAPADAEPLDFRDDLVALIPALRAFARGLCRDRVFADDLVQEAMMRAWASRHTYTPGTNFRAWMFKILRNHFYTAVRKNNRLTSWDPEAAERILVQEPTQENGINVDDVSKAMLKLPAQQREILLLIAGAGLSYEEAAEVAGCNIGTVKSRLNRGRVAIKQMVEGAPPELVG
ncbi:sigma-70 family RNA polymerase sigma factor [Porphyrobacter sp. AAP60]|uniref:sigma-70 family RNA polymerase sigma factor n=1 Tax=Porphyrobacter sp. AAP60 TaxID=1523423 RepID=UPI0006B945E6|nr:sigma-70 family RNA polymerase sigma factor [Porphyrobacter sp. AAP60]KPF65070.1 RNA polymerase subunit sigma-70 [Porphyrobacter sp. AAP60]